MVPQTLPPGQATIGVQLPQTFADTPPPQVCGNVHVPQLASAVPQPLSGVPQFAPSVAQVFGVHAAAVQVPETQLRPALHG